MRKSQASFLEVVFLILVILFSGIFSQLNNRQGVVLSVTSELCQNNTFSLTNNGSVTLSGTLIGNGSSPLTLSVFSPSGLPVAGSSSSSTNSVSFSFRFLTSQSNSTSNIFTVETCGSSTNFQYFILFQFYCDLSSYFTSSTGVQCTPCPVNSARLSLLTLTTNELQACVCDSGYTRDLTNQTNLVCQACPIGLSCIQGQPPTVSNGYYEYIDATAGNQTLFLSCPIPQSCQHQFVNGTFITCSPGYTGVLCNNCEDGFYKLADRCFSCQPIALTGFIVAVWIVFVLVFWISWFFLGNLMSYIGSLSILLTFIQICALTIRFDLQYPEGTYIYLAILSIFNFNVELARLDCLGYYSYYAKMLTMMLYPFPYLILIPLTCFIISGLLLLIKKPRSLVISFVLWNINGVVNFFFNIGYISIVQWSLGTFSCDNLGTQSTFFSWNGANFLCSFSDPSFTAFFVISIIILLIFIFLIPVSLFTMTGIIYFLKKKGSFGPYSNISTYEFLFTAFGSVFGRYRDDRYFWEIIILIKKVAIVILFVFLPAFPVVGAVLCSFVFLFAMGLHLYYKPYRQLSSNLLELFLLILLLLMLMIGLMFYASESTEILINYDAAITAVICSMVSVGIFVGIICVIFELIVFYRKDNVRNRVEKFVENTSHFRSGSKKFDADRYSSPPIGEQQQQQQQQQQHIEMEPTSASDSGGNTGGGQFSNIGVDPRGVINNNNNVSIPSAGGVGLQHVDNGDNDVGRERLSDTAIEPTRSSRGQGEPLNQSDWVEYFDEDSNSYYYYNTRTQQTAWEKPEGL